MEGCGCNAQRCLAEVAHSFALTVLVTGAVINTLLYVQSRRMLFGD